ncbi:MAG: ankyrin repeat domain-containing protein [Bacteroidetes bacterium]|nr:ankyrin repeat domain-containing protein [Bacteroidota bacterium]
MIQPPELKLYLPMTVGGDQVATTTQVWRVLRAAYRGDLEEVKSLGAECQGLLYAQYNYAPPIHFAVRQGHVELVKYLLKEGAHDPDYRIYPFLDSLQTVAGDRGFEEIESLLDEYARCGRVRFRKDNGRIDYGRTAVQTAFEKAVDQNWIEEARSILNDHPEFALDNTYFWSEGILTMPVKDGYFEMAELLLRYGATVPDILKWAQFYYFETYENAVFIMERGMNPNVMNWQRVRLLHDMAQKGAIDKAELLWRDGAEIDPVDDAFQSTPLGLAARWGQVEMVKFLLERGADPFVSGAEWSLPIAWARSKGHVEVVKILEKYY